MPGLSADGTGRRQPKKKEGGRRRAEEGIQSSVLRPLSSVLRSTGPPVGRGGEGCRAVRCRGSTAQPIAEQSSALPADNQGTADPIAQVAAYLERRMPLDQHVPATHATKSGHGGSVLRPRKSNQVDLMTSPRAKPGRPPYGDDRPGSQSIPTSVLHLTRYADARVDALTVPTPPESVT
jgi:hypothetical protein